MSFGPTPPDSDALDVTDDAILGGRLRLKQPRRGHRVGHDAVLLAAAVPARSGDLVIDLGAGVGSAGLALAVRVPGVRVVLVERDAELAALAAENIGRNELAERARVCTLDVAAPYEAFAAAGLMPKSADHVLMNPPFNDPTRHNVSPDAGKRAAHVAESVSLDQWVETARRLLRRGGMLSLIWRAEELAQVLTALEKGFGGIAVRPVHSTPTKPAIRVLIRGAKDSRAPLRIHPALLLEDHNGKTSAEAHAILRQAAALEFPG